MRFIMMKRMKAAAGVIVLLLAAGVWPAPARAEVSFDFFYSNLSPHGSWLVSARYGRVWQPGVYSRDWNPYYDGHWVYADVGWTWVSDFEWGAIPYHYGTWVDDPEFGWAWVPGYVWAPSWVVFRTGPDFIGWAPVSPRFSVGVTAGFGAEAAGPFVFVPARDFMAPRVRTCIVPRSRIIINNTRIVNTLVVERNVVVNRGPDLRIIERASGREVRAVPIDQVPRVAPGRRVTRDQLAVETRGARGGLRVAEPVAASRRVATGVAPSAPARHRQAEHAAPPRSGHPEPRVAGQAGVGQRPPTGYDRKAPPPRTEHRGKKKTDPSRHPDQDRVHP